MNNQAASKEAAFFLWHLNSIFAKFIDHGTGYQH